MSLSSSSFVSRWNQFFHSRITTSANNGIAFQWIRCLRIAYGFCILFDRIMLSLDFDMFFLYPTSRTNHAAIATLPLIPCQQYFLPVKDILTYPDMVNTDFPYSPVCSVAAYFPVSYHSYIFYLFHIVGMINAILLVWNVYPKLQLVLLHVNMISFHFHSSLIWDGEDVMCKVWNFLFLLLPLEVLPSVSKSPTSHGYSTEKGSVTHASYPIWPIRLFQIEVCCIYAGAGYGKLATKVWRSGNALYKVSLYPNHNLLL
jgi:hypothetical protein